MNYLTLDLETTGANVREDEPVQAAWTIHDKFFKKVFTYNAKIASLAPIHPGAERIHGISDQDRKKNGLSPAAFCKNYNNTVWSHQPVCLLGYNLINFDLPMLMNFLHKYGSGSFRFPPVNAIEDVMFSAKEYFKSRKWPRLIATGNLLGIPFNASELHDAMADVELTWKIWRRLCELGGTG